MTRDEAREALARAICASWGYVWEHDPYDDQTCAPDGDEVTYCPRPSQAQFKEAAERVITAMQSDPAIWAALAPWRRIEEAARDGTPSLIWQPSHERYDDKHRGGNYDDNRYAIGYWRTDQDPARHKWMWGNRNAAYVKPTHFLPLPEGPSE